MIDEDDELKNIAGRIPETIRIVVQNNLCPDLDKIRISKKKHSRNNQKSRPILQKALKFFQFRGVGRCWWWWEGGRGLVGGGGGCR